MNACVPGLALIERPGATRKWAVMLTDINSPFARYGRMVQNKLCWDANNAEGLSKQREVGPDW